MQEEQNTQAGMQQERPISPIAAQEQGGGLSFSSEQIADSMRDQLEGEDLQDFKIILETGNELLFGENTHYKLLDGLEGLQGEELAERMAHGAIALTNIIVEQSGGTVPGQLVVPAATVLMARVAEFLNNSNIAQVTDEVFENAMHIFSVKIADESDPEFRNKIQQAEGGMNPAMQQAQPQSAQGILNNGGMDNVA